MADATTDTSDSTPASTPTPAPAPEPTPAREPASRSFLLGGATDALYNSRVYAERLRLQEEIGKRSFPIVGGLGSKLMRIGEEWVMRPLRMATGLVIGAKKVDPERQLPEIPQALGPTLRHDLPESYRNRVEVAEGKNDAMHGIYSLSPTRYQQGNARAVHAQAVAEVRTMPEEQVARNRSIDSRLARLESAGRSDSAPSEGMLGDLSPSGISRRLMQRALA